MGSLAAAYVRFHRWMWDAALPFWAEAGMDGVGRGFHESLALDGSPFGAPFKRVRVQARQVYVFCQAERLGWPGGLAVARRGYDFLLAHGRRQDGGWVKQLGPGGGVLDPDPDLYDLAFVVLALAWFARITQEAAALRLAHATVDWLWTAMAAPEGGWENCLPPDAGPRQQNPHMHLLEALLALYETDPQPVTAERIATVLALFRQHFFDQDSGTLGEFFDRSLARAPGAAGDVVEPGHQYEWVWLLHEHARLLGGPPGAEALRMYAFANRHGSLPNGLLCNVVDRSGKPSDRGTRLWPMTEAIRAHIVMGEAAGQLDDARIARCVELLVGQFLDREPAGTWLDTFDADGGDAIGRIPASSFYHIMGAFAELHRLDIPARAGD